MRTKSEAQIIPLQLRRRVTAGRRLRTQPLRLGQLVPDMGCVFEAEEGVQIMITGGCHCGTIRYQLEGEMIVHALCHCSDCRRHAGAPMVGWTMYPEAAFKVTKGEPKVYASSEHGRRHFCPNCGTGLFYINAQMLPGIVDIQSATYDDPDAVPPLAHIQVAERIKWMAGVHELPTFDRYPPQA